VDDVAPVLQATVEGMTRNLALEDAKVADVGLRGHNIAAMRGGALAAESVEQEGLQVGLISLELKS
jgi:hypothetical protein